jgi:uncharacterized iron-regulated membrane protein
LNNGEIPYEEMSDNTHRAIHTGDILGIPSKAIMSLASLLLVMQLVSGVLIWWKRRKRIPAGV